MNIRFPYQNYIYIKGKKYTSNDIFNKVGQFISKQRKEKIEKILNHRTYSITLVLDNLYDRGNISAVIRSAEALGFQSINIVNEFTNHKLANRVTQGADKWLDISHWKSNKELITNLKKQKYRILITSLNSNIEINKIDFSIPSAIIFGNEKMGISDEFNKAADQSFFFPIKGFVQSYNISVAAALCLYHIYNDRIKKQGFHGDLSQEEKNILKAHYYLKSYAYWEKLF